MLEHSSFGHSPLATSHCYSQNTMTTVSGFIPYTNNTSNKVAYWFRLALCTFPLVRAGPSVSKGNKPTLTYKHYFPHLCWNLGRFRQTNCFWCTDFNRCGLHNWFCCLCGVCASPSTSRTACWLFKDLFIPLPKKDTFMLHNLHWLLLSSWMGRSLTILTLQHHSHRSFFPMSSHIKNIRQFTTGSIF